jgi:hypothetical protein
MVASEPIEIGFLKQRFDDGSSGGTSPDAMNTYAT